MTVPRSQLIVAFFFLVLLSNCKRWGTDISSSSDLEECIRKEMDKQNIPAVSALIFRDETILYESYFGQSNIEDGLELDSSHVFLLASISKTVTAAALLQLYEQGHFDLDDPINDHLPFVVQIPEESGSITFRMLLTHTSGIADGSALDGQYYYGEDSPLALEEFLENYLVPGGDYYDEDENFHAFAPGTEHEYSNVGSALIGVLVEQISGMDFNSYCKQHIFTPLGMEKTFWRLDEVDQQKVMPYYNSRGNYEAVGHYTFTDYPNGGLRSTSRDLFKFLRAHANGGVSGGVQLLAPSTVQELLTPQIPDIDPEVGLHFFLMDKKNDLWGHDGGEMGVSTVMAFHPITRIGVILLANSGDADLDRMLASAYSLGESL